jgi:SWI/SNF-related matrix-associated actin-dependent regulator of chromatin subfamily A3
LNHVLSLTVAAHDIRDSSRLTARAMRHLDAISRWAVTGTPIQNDLSDVASLYQFLRVEPYTEPTAFKQLITRLCKREHTASIAYIKKFFRCIMLRRSIGTVKLPDRRDLVCRLDFDPEEAAVYERAKNNAVELLDDALDSSSSQASSLNVLPWINNLRMICNLGTRAKSLKVSIAPHSWDERAAQEMFNSLVTAGEATCASCSLDLGAVATEVADSISGAPTRPQLSICGYLTCGSCLEQGRGMKCCCSHPGAHRMLSVTTLSSNSSLNDDHISGDDTVPTKIKALLQDITDHIENEKS